MTRRQRIMVITPWHPEPVNNGSKIRARALVEGLSARYDVVLVSMVDEQDQDPDTLPKVPGVWRQFGLAQKTYAPRSLRAIAAVFSRLPRSMVVTWDEEALLAIQAIAISLDVKAVVGADLRVVRYACGVGQHLPVVLDEANVSPFAPDTNQRFAMRAHLRARKYRTLLANLMAGHGVAIVPSVEEAEAYRRITGSGDAIVIENAILRIPEYPWSVQDSNRLLFTGSLTYEPNREAVAYFIRDALPLLKAHLPDVELFVTGAAPAEVAESVRHPQVTITGLLPDIEPMYRSARVFVAPLLSGTGTRTKILEAMSYGMPVVSTSKGIEGLAVTDNEHLLIADRPDEIAAAIARLLDDDALCARLGHAARQLVGERYCWQSRTDVFCEVVDSLLFRRGEE